MDDVPPGDERPKSWEEMVAREMEVLFRERVDSFYGKHSILPQKLYVLNQTKFFWELIRNLHTHHLSEQDTKDIKAVLVSEGFIEAILHFLIKNFPNTSEASAKEKKEFSPLSALAGPLTRLIFGLRTVRREREETQTVVDAIIMHMRKQGITPFSMELEGLANDNDPILPGPRIAS